MVLTRKYVGELFVVRFDVLFTFFLLIIIIIIIIHIIIIIIMFFVITERCGMCNTAYCNLCRPRIVALYFLSMGICKCTGRNYLYFSNVISLI